MCVCVCVCVRVVCVFVCVFDVLDAYVMRSDCMSWNYY